MARRRIFHRRYSYFQGVAVVSGTTLLGLCAGIAFGYEILPDGLTPEEFGHEAAPYTLLGAVLGFTAGALVEYTRWHYARR